MFLPAGSSAVFIECVSSGRLSPFDACADNRKPSLQLLGRTVEHDRTGVHRFGSLVAVLLHATQLTRVTSQMERFIYTYNDNVMPFYYPVEVRRVAAVFSFRAVEPPFVLLAEARPAPRPLQAAQLGLPEGRVRGMAQLARRNGQR